MLPSRGSVAVAVMLLCPALLPAAKVKVWHQHAPAHYDNAQLKQLVQSNEGVLRLSRQLRPLMGLDAAHVWDMVEDRDGNLFVATGDLLNRQHCIDICSRIRPGPDYVAIRKHRDSGKTPCDNHPFFNG